MVQTKSIFVFAVHLILSKSNGNPQHHYGPNTRIINGHEAVPHSVKHMVSVAARLPNGQIQYCGGSLITERHVLTAAHCVHGKTIHEVIVGAHNRSNKFEVGRQVRHKGSYVIHQNFVLHCEYDIAIIKLETPVTINLDYVQNAELPDRTESHKTYAHKNVKAYGWGWTDEKPVVRPDVLQEVDLKIISKAGCISEFRRAQRPVHLNDYEFCTSGLHVVGTCDGDSGSPVILNGIQIGFSVRGMTSACKKSQPSIFIKIAPLMEWITEQLANM